MKGNRTKIIVYSGLLTAAIAVATAIIQVRSPFGGNVNGGDGIIFLATFILGPIAAIPAGIGSCLADIFTGYFVYAPVTLNIKALMALFVALLIKKEGKHPVWNIIILILGESIMISGYFAYEIVLYGYMGAIVNVPLNIVQAIFGVSLGILFLPFSKKIKIL